MLERVAAQVQRHQRVDPRRLDPAPRAVGLLAAHDPALGAREGKAAHERQGAALIQAQGGVQARQPRALGRPRRLLGVLRRPLACTQLVEPERERAHRPQGFYERERDDRLPGPACEVVDVQRRVGRQQHDLGRQRRHAVPRPQPEQREPHMREDPRALESAMRADEARRGEHVLGLGRIAGQAQRPVGLDRGRQLPRSAMEVGPCAVGALLGADPGGRALRPVGTADAEELAQEHVLRVHRDVGLQLSLPPARLVLQREQALTGQPQGDLCPR